MAFIQTGAGGIGSGPQDIEGIKTFLDLPVLPNLPVANEQAANKLYVDTTAGGGAGSIAKRVANWTEGTQFTITHNLNTLDVFIIVRDISNGDIVMMPMAVVDENSVILESSETPPMGGWRVVVMG